MRNHLKMLRGLRTKIQDYLDVQLNLEYKVYEKKFKEILRKITQ